MKRMVWFVLKIIVGLAVVLVGLIVLAIGYARIRPRFDRWYYNNLNLKPAFPPHAFDAETTRQLDIHFSKKDFGNISSFIVWQAGERKYEFHQDGTDPNEPIRVWSISKSVVSAVYGAALHQGHVGAISDPVGPYLADAEAEWDTNPLRADITVADLFTMRSGFIWDELGRYPTDYHKFAASADWVAYMANREMAGPAGESFVYNTANTILLGEVISGQVGQPFEAYAAEVLFNKLGIDHWKWEKGPGGVVQAGGGLHLSPNDMLKIGQLYLQDGVWDGERLIGSDWIDTSTTVQTHVDGYLDYGYHWWVVPEDLSLIEPLQTKDVYFASGLGGNYIFVIPHLEAVVVINAFDSGGEMERAWPALRYFVFPALSGMTESLRDR